MKAISFNFNLLIFKTVSIHPPKPHNLPTPNIPPPLTTHFHVPLTSIMALLALIFYKIILQDNKRMYIY